VYRGDITRLLAKIERDRGLDLSQYRRTYVERRLASRLRSLGLHSYRQYARHIEGDPDEYARMLDALTINVTEFFRDRAVFDAFGSLVIPALVESKSRASHRTIRVWSAGCASGEEPYSIAMALLDGTQGREDDLAISVIGTDLDPASLGAAREGVYDLAKLPGIPEEFRSRYVEVGEGAFRMLSEVADLVRFRTMNLFTDAPPKPLDVVFCRNVFIYFTRDQQARVLGMFLDALGRGGYLVLGRSEKLPAALADRFDTVSGKERIYRKR
jgi:chemotaxis protein methyltransferase CheR